MVYLWDDKCYLAAGLQGSKMATISTDLQVNVSRLCKSRHIIQSRGYQEDNYKRILLNEVSHLTALGKTVPSKGYFMYLTFTAGMCHIPV